MLNAIWAGMIIIGVLVAAFTGKMPDVTNTAIDSSIEAVTVCIRMGGVVAMWSGLMKIGEKSGIVGALSHKMAPFLQFLFPRLEKGSKAMDYIAANFIANILGLGWASTPAGLSAMAEMQKLNPNKQMASREMCMFMIINMSSLQLITVNIISYRSQYNSLNPSEIIGPGLIATFFSSVVAIIAAKLFEAASIHREKSKNRLFTTVKEKRQIA